MAAQAAKRTTPLSGDYLHPPSGTLIEIDEVQHFTSFELLTLDLYPAGTRLGFDLEHYRQLCKELRSVSDRYFRTKSAVGFGPGGRQRRRAYHDALRDLATPATDRSRATPPTETALAYTGAREDRIRDALQVVTSSAALTSFRSVDRLGRNSERGCLRLGLPIR